MRKPLSSYRQHARRMEALKLAGVFALFAIAAPAVAVFAYVWGTGMAAALAQ